MITVSPSELESLRKQHPTTAKSGEYTYGSPEIIHYTKDTKVHIGKFCSIAKNIHILAGGEHSTDKITTYPFHLLLKKEYKDWTETKGNVHIGNDVWIGYGATILSGVTVGDGAVIGAETLVSKDVEPYEIVAGNPQRHIRYRFGEEDRNRLLQLQWWDQPPETLIKIIPFLLTDDIDGLEQILK